MSSSLSHSTSPRFVLVATRTRPDNPRAAPVVSARRAVYRRSSSPSQAPVTDSAATQASVDNPPSDPPPSSSSSSSSSQSGNESDDDSDIDDWVSPPPPADWDHEGVFYVPIPPPTTRDVRRQVLRTLVITLLTMPSRADLLRFALFRVSKRFLVDYAGLWSRDPESGFVDRSQTTSLRSLITVWEDEVATVADAVRDSWRSIRDALTVVVEDLNRAGDAELEGSADTSRGPEEFFKQGFALRAIVNIPTRVPIEYSSDGMLVRCGYFWEEHSMSNVTCDTILHALGESGDQLRCEPPPNLPAPCAWGH
ncbi:hypothetical protein CC1G_02077 [Coprinopsis cinerea okayama7|uniref:Uncharacterized protein n=1 Tax=Coprinopsis cinerea (strain Okayama-7 / 130 / ATCC MYA-4618 / FGSC 9003) TaxID=240176 RepID=A8NK37_COPC7|nr:hypothetical protein CC1G_02077 [Coprinopsis cinerea okayama7\|eukprot:XP_001834341.2 hypothetical protein CC1G_02077 [Coprinopsis cinerea okayama7\